MQPITMDATTAVAATKSLFMMWGLSLWLGTERGLISDHPFARFSVYDLYSRFAIPLPSIFLSEWSEAGMFFYRDRAANGILQNTIYFVRCCRHQKVDHYFLLKHMLMSQSVYR